MSNTPFYFYLRDYIWRHIGYFRLLLKILKDLCLIVGSYFFLDFYKSNVTVTQDRGQKGDWSHYDIC